MTDMLLQKYSTIYQSRSMINDEKYIINDIKKNNKLKESMLSILGTLIGKLFQEQTLEAFLFPSTSWDLYKPHLYEIMNSLEVSPEVALEIKKKLELVSYSNESLKMNPWLDNHTNENTNNDEDSSVIKMNNANMNLAIIQMNGIDTKFTEILDDNPTDFDWASYVDQHILQINQLMQLVLWAIHPSRQHHYESHQLVAKLLLLKINSIEGIQEFEIEDSIWTLVFKIAKLSNTNKMLHVALSSLYNLLNILITYGILKVPTYIRKLISSGVLYLPESNDKFIHCNILINLKISPLMKSQYNMVLRNVMEYDVTYYERFNFEQLQKDAEEIKSKILKSEPLNLSTYPLSVRTMVAEWYLSHLCSDVLSPVDNNILVKNFQIFCVHLKLFHHYYKWIEFIVYHQLLSNIIALETLMDILLCYEKLFSQFINDHILFTKTFIFTYSKVLKEKDPDVYKVISFAAFWKFFMKNFSLVLNIDNDLRTELSVVYEEEKTKHENLHMNKHEALDIYHAINNINPEEKDEHWNFTEAFQTNIKNLLNLTNDNSNEELTFRINLLLLMVVNNREYNKFMSIFLKRKDFKNENLIRLISFKLLTFEQIQNILGITFVLPFLVNENIKGSLYFESHRRKYIKDNYVKILNACESDMDAFYETFLAIVVNFGTSKKLSDSTTKLLIDLFKNNRSTSTHIMEDLLHYGFPKETHELEDDNTLDDSKPVELYSRLDFLNLWIFQSFTAYQIQELLTEYTEPHRSEQELKLFLFDIIELTGPNELSAQLFEKVIHVPTIEIIIKIFEEDFFQRCLTGSDVSREYLATIVELASSLSQKIQKDESRNTPMSETCFRSFQRIMSSFANEDSKKLHTSEPMIDVYLKLFSIHQNSIFEHILNSVQDRRTSEPCHAFIDDMFTLFDRVTFSLRLKLMLYEILSSLKSYSIYASTTGNETGNVKLTIPPKLLQVPPFQVSSFIKEEEDIEDPEELDLGITTTEEHGEYAERNKWFLYDKKEKLYTSPFKSEPYHNITNYQPDTAGSFNNTCLNLSLFNASFERKNPR